MTKCKYVALRIFGDVIRGKFYYKWPFFYGKTYIFIVIIIAAS